MVIIRNSSNTCIYMYQLFITVPSVHFQATFTGTNYSLQSHQYTSRLPSLVPTIHYSLISTLPGYLHWYQVFIAVPLVHFQAGKYGTYMYIYNYMYMYMTTCTCACTCNCRFVLIGRS